MGTVNSSISFRVNGERSRTIKFFTLGCKVNQYETQLIREQFLNSGFCEIDNHLPSDIYVINTCTVTRHADSESFNFMHQAKKENPKARIIVTGCLTELDEDRIKNINHRIIIVKNKDKQNLFGKRDCISYFKGHTRAFLKIQDGCDNFCSYCKVPLVRGRSRSRQLDSIIKEAGKLIKNGTKEIVLCGICLGSYGKDLNPKINLVSVIEALEKIDGQFRIRLSSIEAKDVTEELIEKLNQSKKLCRHLHIPIQSGDDEVLKKMNRNYCRDDYLNLIKRLRSRIPEIAITTDVLVGFPGESENNFRNTQDLIKKIQPLRVHIFPFSPREGTAAYNFKDRVDPKIIKERMQRIKATALACGLTYKEQFLNKNMQVLIECQSKEDPLSWEGYTDNYIKVRVESSQNLKNQLIVLKLKRIDKDYMEADFC